jgi:pimeloyl-ACP methyl ester carboxylesterase
MPANPSSDVRIKTASPIRGVMCRAPTSVGFMTWSSPPGPKASTPEARSQRMLDGPLKRDRPLGHGRSEKRHAPDAYDAAGITADLVVVLDAEGIEQATVWGYSSGGWIACRLAATHPGRVARIVIGGFASHPHEAELPIQTAWCEHLSRGARGAAGGAPGRDAPQRVRRRGAGARSSSSAACEDRLMVSGRPSRMRCSSEPTLTPPYRSAGRCVPTRAFWSDKHSDTAYDALVVLDRDGRGRPF